ncbi:hypothetical protein LZ31DRAFT_360141 [Colletotrichum somersetense]|nr:hypothetical protein LZ31DRAFT_360141 [Colletotrichum somersetense]
MGGYSLMGDCAPQFGIRLLQCHDLLSRAIPGHHDQSGANSRHIRPRGTRDMGTRGQKAQDARCSSRIFREPSARRYAASGHGAAVDHGWLAFGLAVFSYGLGFFHLWEAMGLGRKRKPSPLEPRGGNSVLRIRIIAGTEGRGREARRKRELEKVEGMRLEKGTG